jgi:pilus assembly protein Flp/PilA
MRLNVEAVGQGCGKELPIEFHSQPGWIRGCEQETAVFNSIATSISKFTRDESGATAIEYALIASGIAMAIVVTVQGIGPQLNTKFNSVNTSLK